MPLAGTPPPNKRKKSSKLITDLAHITQEVDTSEQTRSELDLGRKVGTPKDIMLEELSLLKNKGSQMFKMRQQRVNRFIYENNPDVFIPDSNDYHQKFVPGMGGKVDVGGHLVSGRMVGYAGFVAGGEGPATLPRPGSHHAGVGVGVSGGQGHGGGVGGGKGQGHGQQHGGSGLDGGAHHGGGVAGADHGAGGGPGKRKTDVMSMYTSPWERAMKGNEDLIATLKPHMPGPEAPHELRKYKSFNRTAMPYGGVERALQLMRFQLPERKTKDLEPVIVYPHDVGQRPSFNRTPIGWISSGEPSHIHVEMETVETVPFDGETDEL